MQRSAQAVERLGQVSLATARRTPMLLGPADWDRVVQLTKLDIVDRVSRRPTTDGTTPLKQMTPAEMATEGDILPDLRERLLQSVVALYGDAFSKAYLAPDQAFTLGESVERALDEVHTGLVDWSKLAQQLTAVDALEAKPTCVGCNPALLSWGLGDALWQLAAVIICRVCAGCGEW